MMYYQACQVICFNKRVYTLPILRTEIVNQLHLKNKTANKLLLVSADVEVLYQTVAKI